MARPVGFRRFLCGTIAVVWALSGRASPAEPLRLVTDIYLGPSENITDAKAPGFSLEVVRQVFAAMGQDVSFELFPTNRVWMMIIRGERDGEFPTLRNNDQARTICYYPDEPLGLGRYVFFMRTADVGKLKFSSFDDLVGHDVAVSEASSLPAALLEQRELSPELWKFLREHHNMVATNGTPESLRMLAAGRVDYAVVNLNYGMRAIPTMGLSGRVEPLLSPIAFDADFYVCFSKARVSPSLVDAFSRALKQFKQTEAFQAIYHRYFP